MPQFHPAVAPHGHLRTPPRIFKCAAWLGIPLFSIVTCLTSCQLVGTAVSVGLVKLQFGCLPEGTRIDTANGSIPVENLKAGDYITGYNGHPVQIAQIHEYCENPAQSRHLTVHFTNGATVSASPKHRIHGTPAAMLKPGDSCGTTTVSHIESLGQVSRSYDLLTSDPGYRISGIPVNSMIAEMQGL